MQPTLVVATNTARFFLSHRLLLAQAAKKQGYKVICVAPEATERKTITDLGFGFEPLPLSRKGTNVFGEIGTIWSCVQLLRTLQPQVIHAFTIKPVIYFSIAQLFFPTVRMVCTITGLGSAFIDPTLRGKLLRAVIGTLYRVAFFPRKNLRVIFQNSDDQNLFTESGWVRRDLTAIIPGTGVDLEIFKVRPAAESKVCRFAFPARLLKDKGIFETIEAFKRLYAEDNNVRLKIFGDIDAGNPSSLTEAQKNEIQFLPFVESIYLSRNMAADLAQADVAVMPSYREGIPQALMEACAVGLPILTTNVAGCREVVDEGKNGFLVPPKNTELLFHRLRELSLNAKLRERMGKHSRKKAEEKFNYKNLVAANLRIYRG